MSLKMLQYPHFLIGFFGIRFVSSPILLLVLILLGSGERISSIRRIQREISSPYYEDDKSGL